MGAVFVAPHYDLQEVFAGVFGELLQPHIINDDQIWLEVFAERSVLLFESFVLHEVAHQIEDGTVEDFLALFNGFVAQCLGEVRLSNTWRA